MESYYPIGLDIIKLDIAEGSLLGPNEGFTKNVIRKSTRYRIETAAEYRFSILKPPTCSDKFAKVARSNTYHKLAARARTCCKAT